MVRLFIKDKATGAVHEYGTDPHDALVLRPDGSLVYLNLQNGEGSGGDYTFVDAHGANIPEAPDGCVYANIGGISKEPLSMHDVRRLGGKPYFHVSLEGRKDEWRILPEHIAKDPQCYGYGTSWLARLCE